MKAWWVQLAARERRLVVLGAAVLAGGLIYALAWHPLAQGIGRNQARVAQQRSDLAWMLSAARQLQSLRAQTGSRPAPSPLTDQPLIVAVDAALHAQGLDSAIAERTQAEDGSIRLTFKPVPFDALLRCLASLQTGGVRVQALGLDRAGAGQVQGTLQLARASGA